MEVHVQWHMSLIFQARSNPAGVVISNSFHINGGSLGSSCAKTFFNLNLSSFLFSVPIFPVQSFVIPLLWTSCVCFGLCLCLLANTLCVSICAVAPLSWHPRRSLDATSRVTPLCLQTHLCCYNTQGRTRALTSVSSLNPRFLFYWLLFLFLIWGTRSSLMKFTHHASCRWKVRPSAFTSFLTFDITMS